MESEDLSGVVEVRGDAIVEVMPNRAMIHATLAEIVNSGGKKYSDAPRADAVEKHRAKLDNKLKDIADELEGLALDADSIVVKNFRMFREPEESSGFIDKGKQVFHTKMSRGISVKVDAIDKVPAVISLLSKSDVSSVNGIEYESSNSSSHGLEAVSKATEKARGKAEAIAKSLQKNLLGLISIREESRLGSLIGNTRRMPSMAAYSSAKLAMDDEEEDFAPNIPDTLKYHATVSAVWKIES